MSKSSKQRRSDDEFKPPSAKKTKHLKVEEHQSVQRIRLIDLIKYNFLGAGEEVFVKEQEGVITDRGTIKVLSGSGYIEYSNPTSWTKQVTGRENGGWGQIRLKSNKQTLSSIKEQYQKSVSSLEYIEDPENKQLYQPDLNSSTASQPPGDSAPSDLTLPLKVRFIGDEDRVFKIIWVSPDFKEFHTEYQGNLYTNLADFVNKIFEDFQKPSADPNAPPPGNLRFDELMYELSPGKWVRLNGNLFPSELMGQNNQHNGDQTYQPLANQSAQPHILQQSLQQSLQPLHQPLHQSYSNSTPNSTSPSDSKHPNSGNNCNNSNLDGSTNHLHHETSFDDYMDDDDDDDDYVINTSQHNTSNERRRRSSGGKGRTHHMYNNNNNNNNINGSWRRSQCYKCLVYITDTDAPIRVNSFNPMTVRDVLHHVFSESSLKHNNASEADLLRDYSIDIEDQDFGGIRVAFPRSIANFPTKCKIWIKRKEQAEVETTELIEKVNEVHMEDKIKDEQEKEKQSEKVQEDDVTKQDGSGLLV